MSDAILYSAVAFHRTNIKQADYEQTTSTQQERGKKNKCPCCRFFLHIYNDIKGIRSDKEPLLSPLCSFISSFMLINQFSYYLRSTHFRVRAFGEQESSA